MEPDIFDLLDQKLKVKVDTLKINDQFWLIYDEGYEPEMYPFQDSPLIVDHIHNGKIFYSINGWSETAYESLEATDVVYKAPKEFNEDDDYQNEEYWFKILA